MLEAYFSLSGLFNALSSTLLGLLVFSRNRKNVVNKTFAFFCLCVALWSYPYTFWPLAKTKEATLFWFQLLHIGAIFASVAYLYFVVSWLGIYPKIKKIIITGYCLASFFTLFVFSPLFIKDMVPKFSMRYWAEPGILYHFYLLFFFSYALYSSYLLLANYSKTVGAQRAQIKYILIGMIITYIGGSTNYLLWYNIDFPPYGNILASSYVILTAYAIIVHRLMDIKIVLRRSSVYLTSVLSIVLPVGVILYLINRLYPMSLIPASLAVLILGVSIFPAIRNYFYRLANKYFFSSLYDSRAVISSLTDKLRSTLESSRIYYFIADTLKGAFHSKAIGILTYDEKKDQYIAQYNDGFEINEQQSFPNDKTLAEKFTKKNEILVVEEAKREPHEGSAVTLALLDKLGVEILAPLNVKDETIGLIALGAKESRDMYNSEDLGVLETISGQAAISIENAQLYEETKNFTVTLKQEIEKATAELRVANEELKKLDKAKSDFISIASHQLRTPLSAIKGFVSMIIEGEYGEAPAEMSDKLSKIYESNERLIKLVDDLLDLSHMEGGKMKFNFAKVDFSKMTKSVAEELAPQAEKKGLKLKHTGLEKPALVWADEEKLRQVAMNLIDNAIKYTEKGGVEINLKQSGGFIRLAIKDTGFGITKKEIANLFQKFVRGANAPRLHTEGAGIGLYVAKQLIEAQKGRVWAESEGENKGSTFFLEMPVV